MRVRTCEVLMSAALLLAVAAPRTFAQQCDDFFECTTNDMCQGEFCTGAFQAGPCNDFDPCTKNDHCVDDPVFGPDCQGDPAEPGTPCADGCGTCQDFPGVGMLCLSDGSTVGQPCDPGVGTPCFRGECDVQGMFAACVPALVECPDTDGNPCTDSCDIETGQCSPTVPKCLSSCETCNVSSGECEPANQGRACDDGDVCTTQSRCGMLELGEGVVRGFCEAGEPTPGGETPTPLASPTPTQLPGGVCAGDCNNDHMVTVNELILGVNIALSVRTVDACPSFDVSGNNAVEVNELIIAVNHALGSCPT